MNQPIIFQTNYDNKQETITTDIESIIFHVRDFHIQASVTVWHNGNNIAFFSLIDNTKRETATAKN